MARLTLRAMQLLGRSNIRIFRSVVARSALTKPVDMDFEVDFAGLNYRGNLLQSIDRHIYFVGAYAKMELDLLDHCASVIRKNSGKVCFVDIGANVGQHSLYMSSKSDVIYSFEPQASALNQFRRNIKLNRLSNIETFEYALGDSDGEAELGSGFDGNNGSRSLVWTLDSSKNTRISVVHASSALRTVGASKIDIIKMDVEGYEKRVFWGLKDIFVEDRPVILFEMVGKETKGGFASLSELKSALYDNYELFALDGRGKLVDFEWMKHEEAFCIPAEMSDIIIPGWNSRHT